MPVPPEPQQDARARNEWPGWLMLAAAAGAAVVLLASASTRYFSSEAGQYLSTAEQLLAGNGLATSAIYYEVQGLKGMPGIQTAWPPGMPLLIAAVAQATGLTASGAIALINGLAHPASAWLLFWSLGRLLASAWTALVVALCFLAWWEAWTPALMGLSEPMLVLSTVAAAASLIKALDGAEISARWLAAAALATAATCLFHSLGAAVAAALAASAAVVIARRSGSLRALGIAGLLALPATLVLAVMLARNLEVTGQLTGGPSAARTTSAEEIAAQLGWLARDLIGARWDWLSRLAAGTIAVLLAGSLVAELGRGAWRWRARSDMRRAVAWLGISSAVLVPALLAMLIATTTVYALESRSIVAPAALLLLAVAALWPSPAGEPHDAVRRRRAVGGALVTSFAVLLASHLVDQRAFLAEGETVPKLSAALSARIETETTSETVLDLLARSASLDRPVMSNRSQQLYIVLRRPTVGVPERRLTPYTWSPDDLVAYARRFGVEYICIFRAYPQGAADGSDDYVWQIIGNEPAALKLVLANPWLHLYRVRY